MGFLTFSFFFLAIQSASVRGGRGVAPPSQASSSTSMNSQSGMHGGRSFNSAHLSANRRSTSTNGVQD